MRYAYCRFCDDLRFEQGNKISMMGVYAGDIQVSPSPQPGLPVVLPKLCIVTYMDSAVSEPIETMTIKITAGERIVQEATLPPEHLAGLQTDARNNGSAEEPVEIISIGANIVLSPFFIEDFSTVKVVVIADGVEYTAGKLRVRAAAAEVSA